MKTYPKDLAFLHVTIFCNEQPKYKELSAFQVLISSFLLSYTKLTPTQLIFQIAPEEKHAMARFGNSEFAQLSLSKDDEKRFAEWVQSEKVSAVEGLNKLIGEGFKISCSWITSQSSFCFSVIGTDDTKNHQNCVMTSWSDDLEEVILIAAYKHFVVCDGQAWPMATDGTRWG